MKKVAIFTLGLVVTVMAQTQSPPSIEPISDLLVLANTEIAFTATAVPQNHYDWNLDSTSIGKGMALDSVTGEFTWTPTEAHIGSHAVTVFAADDNGLSASTSFNIDVSATSITLDPVGNQSVNENLTLSFTASAIATGESATPIFSLEDGISGLVPPGANINPTTGLFEWQTTENDGPGTYKFDVVATHADNGNITQSDTIVVDVFEINAPPVIDLINDKFVDAGTQLVFMATFVDPDLPANTVSWSLDTPSLSKGMSINTGTGEFTWMPTAAQTGSHSVTVSATDNGSPAAEDSLTFNIDVSLSILLDPIEDQNISEGTLLSFSVSASIPDDGATPVFSLQDGDAFVPSGATIDPSSGVFQWQPTELDGPGTYAFDIVATRSDDSLIFDGSTIFIDVLEVNLPPAIDPIAHKTVDAGSSLNFTATAVDPDVPAQGITWSLNPESTSKGMTIDAANGVFNWNPTAAQAGSHLVFVTAQDVSISGLTPALTPALTPELNPELNPEFTAELNPGVTTELNPGESGSTTISFNIEVNLTLALDLIGNKTTNENNLLNFTANAVTLDDSAVPVYSLEDGVTGAVPIGATIDPNSGIFSWLPGESGGPGLFNFDVVASRSDGGLVSTPGFNRGLAVPNWVTIAQSPASSFNHTNTVLSISTGNGGGGITRSIAIPKDGVISFDWGVQLTGSGSFGLRYAINGNQTDISTVSGAGFTSGISVVEGDVFEIYTWGSTANTTYTASVSNLSYFTNSIAQSISVDVFEINEMPLIDPISDSAVQANVQIALTATASDIDLPANTLSWSLDATSLGKSMAINAATGDFIWTPTPQQIGNHPVTVTVTDDGIPRLSNSLTFHIQVTQGIINLSPIGSRIIDEASLLSFTAIANIPDAINGFPTPIYSLDAGQTGIVPASASIDPNSGLFSWQTSEIDGPGTFTLDVVATRSDNNLATDRETISITVSEVNVAPGIDFISDTIIQANQVLAFTATASDLDIPANTVTWNLDTASVSKGMTINPATGYLAWTPTLAQLGSHQVTITVTDDGVLPLSDNQAFNIEVTQGTIAIDSIPNQFETENNLVTFTATATVSGNNASPIFSLAADEEDFIPQGATIDANTGIFSWQTDETDGPGTFTFRVTATRSDDPLAADSVLVSIQISESNAPPVIDFIGDASILAGSLLTFTTSATDPDIPANTLGFYLDNGSVTKGMQINSGTGEFSWTPSVEQIGSHTVTAIVQDNGVNPENDSQSFTIEVTKGTISLSPIISQTIDENNTLNFIAVATVPDGNASPIYSLEEGEVGAIPSGASIDPSSGLFNWQTSESDGPQSRNFDVVATRSDDPSVTDRKTITIQVSEINESPQINAINDTSAQAASLFQFTATATDPDVPLNVITWGIDSVSQAKGMTITTGGDFAWTPASNQVGSHSVTVTAQDDGSPSLVDSVTFSIEVTRATIVLDAIADQTINENDQLSFVATATIPDGNASPIYSLEDGELGFIPDGASISTNTGIFSWETNELDGPGTYTFDVVATRSDDANAKDFQSVSIQVAEVNRPPTIDPINTQSVQATSLLAFNLSATDPNLPRNLINWTIETTSAGMIIDSRSGEFRWTPTAEQVGSHTVTAVARDNGNPPLSSSLAFSIEVTRATIILDGIGDQAVDENRVLSFTATATTSGNTSTPVFTLENGAAGAIPSGASINPNSGVFQWIPNESQGPGTVTFDVVATHSDDAATSDRETISVIVSEINQAPVIDPINNTSVQAAALLAFVATATDPDLPPETISWTVDAASASQGMTINAATGAFTWTPTSAQVGNHTATITATDTGNPPLSDSFSFDVEVTRASITLESIANQTIEENSLLAFFAIATTSGEGATPIYSLEEGALGSVPIGANIDPISGEFRWTPNETQGPQTFEFDIVATRSDDAIAIDRETISVVVTEVNLPPVVTAIADTTIQAANLFSLIATATDPDVPDDTISWAIDSASSFKGIGINTGTGELSWAPTAAHIGNHAVIVIAQDNGTPPLNDTASFTLEVTRATITLEAIDGQSIAEETQLSFTAVATVSGEGNATPIYSLQGDGVPSGASIDPSTGVFEWIPNEAQGPGTFSFDVVATRSDDASAFDRENIVIQVSEGNLPPIINPINNPTVEAGSSLAFAVNATDPDLPPNAIIWTIDAASAAKGMSIGVATGAFGWTPTAAQVGSHTVTVTATDNGNPPLNDTVTFVIEVTRATIELAAIAQQSVDEETPLTFVAFATVSGDNATPVYSIGGSIPNGATIDPVSGVFQWTPQETDGPGNVEFEIIATRSDDPAATDREPVTIQVGEENMAPVIDPINNTIIQSASLLAFTPTASDPDLPANVLLWSIDAGSTAKGMTINGDTAAFSWTPSATRVGTHTVTVTVTDNGNPPLQDSVNVMIEVTRASISLSIIEDQSINEIETLTFNASATIENDTATPIYALEDGATGAVPSGASIDPTTGAFQWTPTESQGPETYNFDVIATRSDDAIAVDRKPVLIEVNEVNLPITVDPIDDQTVQAFDQLVFTANAVDPDLPANTFTWSIDGASEGKNMEIDPETGAFRWIPSASHIGSHTVTVAVNDSGEPASGDDSTFSIEVAPGEPPVVFLGSASPDTLHEPNSFSLGQNDGSQGPFHFTVTRTKSFGDQQVTLRLESSSQATFGTDFVTSVLSNSPSERTPLVFSGNPPTATLSIPDGDPTASILIEVIDDDSAEAAESIVLSIVTSEEFNIGISTAIQTIPRNDFKVTSLGDFDPNSSNGGEGTLRHAINNAKVGLSLPNNPDKTIELTFSSELTGEIVLTGGPIFLDTIDLTISGPGSDILAINGGNTSRVIVAQGEERSYSISGISLTNGRSEGNGGAIFNSASLTLTKCTISDSVADHGGAITNEGLLRMDNCVISGNYAQVYGGGIDNFSGAAAIFGCNISGNEAEFGGGIENSTGGELIIDGCTITGNNALSGGGVDSFSAITQIINSTISGNTAGFGAGVFNEKSEVSISSTTIVSNAAVTAVGGILTSSTSPIGTTVINNTIVAGNTEAVDFPSDIASNNESFINLNLGSSANIIGDANSSGGLFDGINLNQVGIGGVGVRPLNSIVGPLEVNGGPTATHALAEGSPAIDAGNNQAAPNNTFDQRGIPVTNTSSLGGSPTYLRTVNDVIDIGAFEVQLPSIERNAVSLSFIGREPTIVWNSIPGLRYDILSSTDLLNWIVVAEGLNAVSDLSNYADENAPEIQAYYSIRVSEQQ